MEAQSSPPKARHSPFVSVLIFFEVIFLIALGIGFYFFLVPNNPVLHWFQGLTSKSSEVKTLTARVGALALLPEGEEPTMATVSDKSKLQGQPFFANAENGDKVLIYTNAKKAFLYRPSTNKIIEIAPINFSPATGQPSSAARQEAVIPAVASPSAQTVQVAVYYGNKTSTLADTVDKLIKEKAPNVSITSRGPATLSYTKNLVVDVTGANRELTAMLAGIIGGEVSGMPAGEVVPKTPILIILGK